MNGKNNQVLQQQFDSDDEPPALIDLPRRQGQNSRQNSPEQTQENQKLQTLVSNSSNIVRKKKKLQILNKYPSLGSIQEVPEETKREVQMPSTYDHVRTFESILGKTIVIQSMEIKSIEQKIYQISEELMEQLKESLLKEDDEISDEQLNQMLIYQQLGMEQNIPTIQKPQQNLKKEQRTHMETANLIKLIRKLLLDRTFQKKNIEILLQTVENLYHNFLKIEINQNLELLANTPEREKLLKMQIQSLNQQVIEKQKDNEISLQQFQKSYEEMELIINQLKQQITDQLKEIRHWKQQEQILSIQIAVKQNKQLNQATNGSIEKRMNLHKDNQIKINPDENLNRNQNNFNQYENYDNSNSKGRNQQSNIKTSVNSVKLLSAGFFRKFGRQQ